mgnify:CR=1 FL=1
MLQMMKKISVFAGLVLALSGSVSAGAEEKALADRTVKVEQFSKINLGGTFDVEYEMTDGDAYVVVYAPEKALDKLDVRVKNGELSINVDKGLIRVNLNMKVKVKAYSRTLNEVVLSGACDFECEKGIDTDTFKAQVNGTGELKVNNLDAEDAKLVIAGAGSIEADDIDVENLEVKISGAGDAEVEGDARNAKIIVSGVGSADIHKLNVLGNLETKMSGIGSIKR